MKRPEEKKTAQGACREADRKTQVAESSCPPKKNIRARLHFAKTREMGAQLLNSNSYVGAVSIELDRSEVTEMKKMISFELVGLYGQNKTKVGCVDFF